MQTAYLLLRAEALKLRGSKFIWLVLGIPGITLALHLGLVFDRAPITIDDPGTFWTRMLGVGWSFWFIFILPLFIALAAASLLNLEHRGNHWKQLFAWPIPRWGVYASKLVFGLLFATVAGLVFALGMVADILFLSLIKQYGLQTAIPWSVVLAAWFRASLACLPAVAIQTWISARFRGFAAPLGIGLGALIIGLMLTSLRSQTLLRFYPWTLPSATLASPATPQADPQTAALTGLIGGIVIAALVCWELARRTDVE